jgi:hypothetical protein
VSRPLHNSAEKDRKPKPDEGTVAHNLESWSAG